MKRILVLCVGLLFLVAVGCGGNKTYSGNTPEEVAKAYYEALKDGKPEIAYDFRKFDPPKSKDEFVKEKKGNPMPIKSVAVEKAKIVGNKATVTVKLKTGNTSMPEIPINVTLEKGNTWKITSTGMGGGMGSGAGMTPPAGMPGGMPPAGSTQGSGGAPASPNASGGTTTPNK